MIRRLIVVIMTTSLLLTSELRTAASGSYLDVYSASNFPEISKLFLANKNHASKPLSAADMTSIELEGLPIVNKDNLSPEFPHSACQLVQIVHLLHQAGCQPKAISSFACAGSCSSYVQVSILNGSRS